jgi:NAD(P)-dependent dehydrogenase (short-subunit alcohol dehydrogenase family)
MTIVVTGASRGLGRALATRLSAVPITRADADLSRMDDVRRLARQITERHPDLNVLINNAGASKFERTVTLDGFETTFATNYVAPFLLTNLLLPTLTHNRGVVVNVTSEQHRFVRAIPWDDLQAERRWRPTEQYSLTKLYLVLFTREIARRAPAITATCVSPGFLRTDLGREARGSFRVFLTLSRPFQRSAEHGADAVIAAMRSGVSGAYFRGTRQVPPSRLALDEAAAARLWELSARWLEAAKLG